MKNSLILLCLLSSTVFFTCRESAKDDSIKSVENIEDVAEAFVEYEVAIADDTVVNNKDIANEFIENTKAGEPASQLSKESVDLEAKNTKEVIAHSSHKTEDIVQDAEGKNKNVELVVENTKQSFEESTKKVNEPEAVNKNKEFIENSTQKTKDHVREKEEKTKEVDLTVKKTKQPIEGIWDTGTEKTNVEIVQINGEWMGKIKSSDNQEVTLGKVILKDLKKQNEKWKGKLFVVKRQKWTDVEITPSGTKLDLVVSAGFSNKKVQWSKVND